MIIWRKTCPSLFFSRLFFLKKHVFELCEYHKYRAIWIFKPYNNKGLNLNLRNDQALYPVTYDMILVSASLQINLFVLWVLVHLNFHTFSRSSSSSLSSRSSSICSSSKSSSSSSSSSRSRSSSSSSSVLFHAHQETCSIHINHIIRIICSF